MTAHDMLTQARQGDPQAIAAILNHFTRPKEITTNVSKDATALRIVFSAHRLPNQEVMTNFVQRSIEQLDINVVDTVHVTGQRVGTDPAEWNTEISLAAPADISLPPREDAVTIAPGERSEVTRTELDGSLPSDQGSPPASLAIATPAAMVSQPAAPLSVSPSQNGHYVEVSKGDTGSAITLSDSAPPATTAGQSLQDLADSPIMRRPEVVVLLLFVLVLILWQTYLSIIEGAAPEGSLNGRELARRLAVSYSTISRRKHREDFSQWSQALDPDGITWVYTEGVFVPQL